MRVSFKFTIALAVVAALASSISAIPTNADAGYYCPVFCRHTRECNDCNCTEDHSFLFGVTTWTNEIELQVSICIQSSSKASRFLYLPTVQPPVLVYSMVLYPF
ncbi:hypothetical protein CY34DRAFT_812122, partial [Suillus luteus UH-Slu-Lm8-n1]